MTLMPPAPPSLAPILANLTPQQLQAALAPACTGAMAAQWLPHITQACARFAIHTPARLADFLAQIGHESLGLARLAEIWGPTDAQRRYEGRSDLGNTQPGDGSKFRGHGAIQITGRANHARARDALRANGYTECPDFEADPKALMLPAWAAASAAWYWRDHGCNELADTGDFITQTRRINGGTNGLADRQARRARARKALGVA